MFFLKFIISYDDFLILRYIYVLCYDLLIYCVAFEVCKLNWVLINFGVNVVNLVSKFFIKNILKFIIYEILFFLDGILI